MVHNYSDRNKRVTGGFLGSHLEGRLFFEHAVLVVSHEAEDAVFYFGEGIDTHQFGANLGSAADAFEVPLIILSEVRYAAMFTAKFAVAAKMDKAYLNSLGKGCNVIASCRKELFGLAEDERVADGGSGDHRTVGAELIKCPLCCFRRSYITIDKNGY